MIILKKMLVFDAKKILEWTRNDNLELDFHLIFKMKPIFYFKNKKIIKTLITLLFVLILH